MRLDTYRSGKLFIFAKTILIRLAYLVTRPEQGNLWIMFSVDMSLTAVSAKQNAFILTYSLHAKSMNDPLVYFTEFYRLLRRYKFVEIDRKVSFCGWLNVLM